MTPAPASLPVPRTVRLPRLEAPRRSLQAPPLTLPERAVLAGLRCLRVRVAVVVEVSR